MKFGLNKTTIEKICSVFARFPQIEKAVLYGSRAKGNFKPGSDIDLTLHGGALTGDLRSAIASALDDLLLPYTIDLSVFDDLDHVQLREHIERVGVVFYQRQSAGQLQGAVMKKGWKKSALGDTCEMYQPKTISAKELVENGAYPVDVNEQKRIVGILDEAFDAIATAKANAEKNLQNARALFESHLQSVFTHRGEGWVEKPFEHCIEDVKYTRKIQRKDFLTEGKFPIVSQESEFTNGYYRLLKELQISYPDLDNQVAIAEKLDALSEETQRLASIYERKLAALDALKKSLLHQAFTGQL